MTEKITYEIYTDNPPPNSRPLKSQVSELRKEIKNMRLTIEERAVLQTLRDNHAQCEDDKMFLKIADILTGLLERL